ncbi:hypothetical protein CSPHI_09700 [Corynebacterium sphenisci DSM 44792]|uniref:Uncharacterized protein n=1 Tax=Corynebacterium sphenisci DSM 44792 TaxID=1437874 RepID=A0A1L7CZH6_9CORY|nr:hypothetical protein [Corynebacterium sphenisci]APT91234.1 hypothetical protein CSPHI_09700 [Corynebacterium sphenisci DSM 44792]
MHAVTRTIAAAATVAGLLIAAPGAAGALDTVDDPGKSKALSPVEQPAESFIISPYGQEATCFSLLGGKGGKDPVCYQQRYDGKWVRLIGVVDSVYVYPVWEDPQAMLDALPPEIRDAVAEALGL